MASGQANKYIARRLGVSESTVKFHLEEAFARLAMSRRAEEASALGLRLAIVQRMVRLLGHGLGLPSRAGFGTSAWIDLPRLAPIAPESSDTSDPGFQGVAPLRVAVIEADAAVRVAIGDLLMRWGHRVTAVSTAVEVPATWRAQGGAALHAVIIDPRLGNGGDGLAMVTCARVGPTPMPRH